MRRIYLDHNATTPLAPEVFEAMKPYWLEDYGNASSIHWYGQRAKAAVEAARVEVARLINADPSAAPRAITPRSSGWPRRLSPPRRTGPGT